MNGKFLLVFTDDKTKSMEGSFYKLVCEAFGQATIKGLYPASMKSETSFRTSWIISGNDSKEFAKIIPNKIS